MKNFRFITYLTSNIDIDRSSLDELFAHCKTKQVAKGDFLLKEGEKCDVSFFVEQGLLKQYYIDDRGKEHILQFGPENWFVTDRDSVYFNQPSKYFIQALEDTIVFMVNEEIINKLSRENPYFLELNHKLLHNHIRQLQKRIVQLLSGTAEERYLDFVKTYPDILMRVPQTMVASYLGIAPESLSRTRKELAAKNFKK